jgi:hypothetical protein
MGPARPDRSELASKGRPRGRKRIFSHIHRLGRICSRPWSLDMRGCTLGGCSSIVLSALVAGYAWLHVGRVFFNCFRIRNRSFLGSGRPREPGRPFQKAGGFAPHLLEWSPGPPGSPRPPKWPISDPEKIEQIYSHPKCSHVWSVFQAPEALQTNDP